MADIFQLTIRGLRLQGKVRFDYAILHNPRPAEGHHLLQTTFLLFHMHWP